MISQNTFKTRIVESAYPIIAGVISVSLVLSGVLATAFDKTYALHSECSDGLDNDENGLFDYPQDLGCLTPEDDYEGPHLTGNFITVTDERDQIEPGGSVIYIITLKQQRENSRNVDVELHLPFQSNIVSASDGGESSPGLVRWRNVSIYKNVTRSLQVNVNVSPEAKPGQYLVSKASVAGMTATDTTLVTAKAVPIQSRLSVSLTDNLEYVLPGEVMTYRTTVRNDGSAAVKSDLRLVIPFETQFVSASDGGVKDSYDVIWYGVILKPGETRTYTASARVDLRTSDKLIIRARAFMGVASDIDQTVVNTGLPYGAITPSISDNRKSARTGDTLTYAINMKNNSSTVGTQISANASLPRFGEFVSATEGGYFDGTNVRWPNVLIAPDGYRTLSFSVRVRSDAPNGAMLVASVFSDGVTDRDTTIVGSEAVQENRVIFRKTSSMREAVPGSRINYAITVRNTLDRVISDATVLDRFNPAYLSLEQNDSPEYLLSFSEGKMVWKVPVLKPGDSWTVRYVLAVSENAPNGLMLENIAQLRGADLGDVALNERVSTSKTGVLREFPTTGVGMDRILAMMLMIFGAFSVGLQKTISYKLGENTAA